MADKALRCSECGRTDEAKFVFDPSGKFFTCACGAVNKLYDNYTVTKIEGVATVETRLRRIEQLLDENNIDKADALCKEILEIEPECYQAWWYRYVCAKTVAEYYGYEDQYGRKDSYTQASIRAKNLEYADRAIQYAPEQVKSTYRQGTQEDRNFISSVKNGNMEQKANGSKGFCYIATAVYGSYSAPQVYTLRKFRDRVLMKNVAGRLFVKTYYRVGPAIAKSIGKWHILNSFVHKLLDRFVRVLNKKWDD